MWRSVHSSAVQSIVEEKRENQRFQLEQLKKRLQQRKERRLQLLKESKEKDAQKKDFGNVLRGHGGVLDRIDSLVFVSIATAIFCVFIMNGWNFFL